MLFITQISKGKFEKSCVFRSDYPTMGSTEVLDYNHVAEIVEGYVTVLKNLTASVKIYKFGTDKDTNILKLAEVFEEKQY